jgi:superkiller protein 3
MQLFFKNLLFSTLCATVVFSQTPATLRQALDAIQSKDYQKAIGLLETEIKRVPDMEEAHYYLGLALWEAGRRDEGVAAMKKAHQLASKNPEYTYQLGYFYLEQKNFVEAKSIFNEGLKLKNNKSKFLYGLGLVYVAQDSIDQGLVYLLQAREADPNDSKVYRSIGDAYAKQKVLSLAIDNYSKAVEIEPGWLEVHFTMGKLLFRERRVNEALAAFKKAAEIDPNNAEAHYEVGNLYYLAKRPQEALPELEKAVMLQPKSYQNQLLLAKSQYASRQVSEAVASAERAYEIDPTTDALNLLAKLYFDSRDTTNLRKSVEAYTKLSQSDDYQLEGEDYLRWGRALSRLQRYAEAIPKYETFLKADSTQMDVYNEVGGLYLREKRFDEAIAAFDRKINANSFELKTRSDSTSMARVYFNKGMCYMLKQDYASAVTNLRSGLFLENNFKQAWTWLAQSYSQVDSSEQMKAAYEQVLRLDPTSSEANRQIGVYYLVKKNFDGAIAYLKKAVELESNHELSHLWLAQAYHSVAKVPEACAEYKTTLRINSKNADAIKGMKLLGCE